MASTKRPIQPNVKTDEWGLYDPATAGMPALFARLGKPVLRQSDHSARRDKRRATRPERSNDGVCLAIEEVRRRAFPDPEVVPPPAASLTPVAPALVKKAPAAAEVTRRARRAAKGAATKADAAARHSMRNALIEAAAKAEATTTMARPSKRGAAAKPAATAVVEPPAPKAARTRKAASPQKAAPRVGADSKRAPAVPPPSPRRPRGPVPLAAWAHAVTDAPAQEPKRHDARGLWRSLFRIPSEVALVQYGRGCRIHRLVIEEPAETVDFY